ncbi:MAG: hypothetical protein WC162_04125 [Sphaerochaetaceae bacterium]
MKKFLIFLILLCLVTSLYAFDFVTEIEEISMHPDFWAGIFPSYIAYKLKLQIFEFIPGNETELSVLLSTGIQPRVITQNPINGAPVWEDKWNDDSYTALNSLKLADYDTMASSWALTFGQGFGERKNESRKDPLFVWASFDGQWEQSLNPILQGLDRKGYPFDNLVFDYTVTDDEISDYETLVGTPDLQGDRQLLSMSLNLGFNIEMLELNTASIQGVDAKLKFTYAPEKLGNSFTGKSDFIKLWLWAETGFTIFQLKDENALNKMSFVVVDDFEFRFLTGSQIPKWAEKTYGTVWNVENINSPVFLRNSTKLYYYGRQFLNGLAVPSFMLFFDLGYNGGNLNNTTTSLTIPLNFFTGSYGVQINLKMFNFLYIYYEIGHVLWDNLGGSSHFESSETIKFLIKLNY